MSKEVLLSYLSKLVEIADNDIERFLLIGGYASLCYNIIMETEPPVFTTDLDLLMRDTDPSDRSLKKKLIDFNFKVKISEKGEEKFFNPAWTENHGIVFEIEFLIPLIGRTDKPRPIKDYGIKPQGLRFLDILLRNHWTFELDLGKKIKIPHPARYLTQKLLSYNRRKERHKKKNDIIYIANIIDLFSDEKKIFILTDEINLLLKEREIWTKRAIKNYKDLFLSKSSTGIEILISNNTPLTVDQIKYQAQFFIQHLR